MKRVFRRMLKSTKTFVRSIPTGAFVLLASFSYHRHYFILDLFRNTHNSNITSGERLLHVEETITAIEIIVCLSCAVINFLNDRDRTRKRSND